jgi:azurin
MQYDKKVLSASPGQEITLTLNHTGKGQKTMMGHNFVLLKKGVDVDDFARRAIEARDTEFIPEGDEMIAYTKLIGGGESVTISFEAPEKGIYNFICSFPAHYQLMRGQLIVK